MSIDTSIEAPRVDPSAGGAREGELRALRLRSLGDDTAVLSLGTRQVQAAIDESVDRAVLEGALSRGERVIAVQEGGTWTLLGVPRTRATPGLEAGDDYTIEANRVKVVANHSFLVRSGPTSFSMRAQGFVETLAKDISTRATAVHKLIGRLVRIN